MSKVTPNTYQTKTIVEKTVNKIRQYIMIAIPGVSLYLIQLVISLVIAVFMVFAGTNNVATLTIASLIAGAVITHAVYYVIGINNYPDYVLNVKKKISFKNNKKFLLLSIAAFAFLAASSQLFVTLINKIFNISVSGTNLTGNYSVNQFIVLIITIVFIVPTYEEIMRYLTMRAAGRVFNKFITINIVQSIIFGLLHFNVIQCIYTCFCGYLLGIVLMRYSIKTSMLMHSAFNLFGAVPLAAILVGLSDSVLVVVISLIISITLTLYFAKKSIFSTNKKIMSDYIHLKLDKRKD